MNISDLIAALRKLEMSGATHVQIPDEDDAADFGIQIEPSGRVLLDVTMSPGEVYVSE